MTPDDNNKHKYKTYSYPVPDIIYVYKEDINNKSNIFGFAIVYFNITILLLIEAKNRGIGG